MSKIARVKSHILEWIIGGLMTLFGLAAVYIFINAASGGGSQDAAIIEILLIIVLAILAQTGILIRIYEQHR